MHEQLHMQWAQVQSIVEETKAYQICLVTSPQEQGCLGTSLKLFNYPQLLGSLHEGDLVLINTQALELGLGTGGFGFACAALPKAVVQNYPQLLSQLQHNAAQMHQAADQSRRIVKMRYNPFQYLVQSLEAQESALHSSLKDRVCFKQLGYPVISCELHSQSLAVIASLKSLDPQLKIAYIMTDEASLLAAQAMMLDKFIKQKLIDECICVGQALACHERGDKDAVSLASALLAAEELTCDCAIVSMGPGSVGTGTALGTTALAQAEALNTTASLGGSPLCCLRASSADKRERHLGISHHSKTVLQQFCLRPVLCALPDLSKIEGLSEENKKGWDRQVQELKNPQALKDGKSSLSYHSFEQHSFVTPEQLLEDFLEHSNKSAESPSSQDTQIQRQLLELRDKYKSLIPGEDQALVLRSMGRTYEQDRLFFESCKASALALCLKRLGLIT